MPFLTFNQPNTEATLRPVNTDMVVFRGLGRDDVPTRSWVDRLYDDIDVKGFDSREAGDEPVRHHGGQEQAADRRDATLRHPLLHLLSMEDQYLLPRYSSIRLHGIRR